MKNRRIMMAAVLTTVALLGLQGCESGDDMESQDTATDPAMGVVNSTCPIMGSGVDPNTESYRMHDGYKVGFCCPGCTDDWEAKADAEKTAFIQQQAAGNMGAVGTKAKTCGEGHCDPGAAPGAIGETPECGCKSSE